MKTFAKRVLGYTLVTLLALSAGILLIPAIGLVFCLYAGTRIKCNMLNKHSYDFKNFLTYIDRNVRCMYCNHEASEEEMDMFRMDAKLAPLFVIRDIAIEAKNVEQARLENDKLALQNEPIVAVQRNALDGQ